MSQVIKPYPTTYEELRVARPWWMVLAERFAWGRQADREPQCGHNEEADVSTQ